MAEPMMKKEAGLERMSSVVRRVFRMQRMRHREKNAWLELKRTRTGKRVG